MIPVNCRVKHDPANGTYGDCIRACIATMMELDAEKVPHFKHDDCDGPTLNKRIRTWLEMHNFAPFWLHYDGKDSLKDTLAMIGELNTNATYMLYGSIVGGDHVMVCRGDKIVHDPAWFPQTFVGPGSHGFWSVMLITKL